MRYEDTSGTLGSAGTPEARDDADKLLANSNAPATGNVITGAGTTTGKEGADTPQTGHVVSVRGAGGTDTSDSGQTLHVEGRYGTLSMDEHGNYRYVPEARHPNDVRDLFQYTLATAKGQSTADLVIELGGGAVKVNANAQQIVPGPDGVVTLPAGVDLSDVHVVGRNLVVNLPDGSQIVIVDGAVFVPQLVVGGVELPSTNLAALLIDAEPKPAAGSSQSSGGNFEVPIPPLDPGTPLGDLIPPVEMHFQPPEFIPVGQFINHEPTIEIQPDNQPASVAAVDEVNEKGLPTRNGGEPAGTGEIADGNGSNNSDTSETTAGTIIIDSQDGIGSVTINGVLVTGAVGQTISGAFGTLTITGFSGQNILYSYTLADNTSGDNTHDDFSVTVTDSDGDQASATLTIDIIDDTPIARDDTDAVVKPSNSTDGNVLTGANTTSGVAGADTPGADDLPNGVTGIHPGTSGTFTDVTSGGVLVHGTFGDLVIHSDGSYTYTVTVNGSPGGNDVFTYEITDGDGDVDTATLTITVPADSIPVAANATALVDDEGLPGGIPGGAGDDVQNPDPDNDESTFSGTVTANFGGDGPGTFAFGSGVDGSSATIGQEQVTYHVVGGVLTAEITSSPDAGRVGTDLFTVTLNSDGTYTVQLLENVLHPTLDGQTGDNTENNVSAAITFTATDSDGDTGNGTLTINFDDDIPTASNEQVTGTVDEDGVPGGIAGGVGDVAGEDTVATGSVAAMFNSGADQPLSYSLLTDTSGLPALTSGGLTVHYSVSGNTLTAYTGATPADGVVFTLTVASNGNYTFTLLDQLDHPSLDGQAGDNTENDLNLALGSIIQATDSDGDSVAGNSNGLVITVDDDTPTASENQVTGTVDEDGVPGGIAGGVGDVAGENTVATGNISGLFNSGADAPLSYSLLTDTSGLPALTSAGLTIHYSVSGNTLTAYTGATPADGVVFTFSVNASTGAYTFTLVDQLDHPTLNGLTGDDTENDLNIDLSSIVQATDADGDSVSAATGGIVIIVDDDTPVANNDVDSTGGVGTTATGNVLTGVDHAGGDANTTDGVADQFGADQPGSIIGLVGFGGSTDTNPSGGFDVVGQYGTLHIDANGDYTYTRTGGPGGATDTFTYTIQDFDGDKTTATLTITLGDSTPTAGTVNATLDDDALAGGNPGGVGDDSPDTSNLSGSLPGSGGDAPLTFGFGSNVAPAGFTYDTSTPGTLLIKQGATTVITVTINSATGAYTIVQNHAIDHPAGSDENNVSFAISYTVTDSDTDVANGTININVDDDTPTVSANGTVQLDDDALAGGNAGGVGDDPNSANTSGTLGHSYGADGAGSIAYLTTGAPAGFSYALQGNGDLWVMQGANHVLTLTVNSTTGAYTVTQVAPIDHPAGNDENNVIFTISYSVTDHDGDSATGTLTVNVDDDTPTVSANGTVQLDDDALAGGNAGGTGDDADSANTTGTLGHSFGADGAGSIAYLTTGAPSGFSYVLQGNGDLWVMQGATHVLTLTVNSATGAYSVTQVHAIDHVAGSDENNQVFTISYSVTDHDGDSATGTLTVNVDDDTPTVSANSTVQLDDDALAGGNAGGTGDDPNAVNTTGTLGHSFGADGAGSVAYLNTGAPAGFTYSLQGNGDLWVLQGATHVLTLTVNTTTGAYSVTQVAPISHPAGSDENNVVFTINYQVTDHDGDTANGTLTVNVDDDTPTIGTVQSQQTDNNPATTPAIGTLHFSAGADGAGSTMTITADNTGIKSGGHNLVTNQVGNVLTAYQDINNNGTYDSGTDNVAVYTVTVNPSAGTSGQYVFDLLTALDPTVTNTPIGGSSAFGAGPAQAQQLTDGGSQNLAIVSGWHAGASFSFANWFNGTNTFANDLTLQDVNGSTSGWGVDNNNFTTGEFMRFDFGEPLDDFDGAGPYDTSSGALNQPEISFATFKLTGYIATEHVYFVIHYTDGTTSNLTVTGAALVAAGSTPFEIDAPAGKHIDWIDLYTPDASGNGKVDLVSVGVTTSTLDVTPHFTVQLTDGDGDPTATAGFDVHIGTGLVPFAPAAPVVLDLNGDGVHFLSAAAGVTYDYGNGAVATAWASPQDGILVLDANHNGTVDNASEFVFGSGSVTDLQALAAYDTNHDGQLTAADASFSSFAVWQDANSNGVADAGEVQTLTARGITAISLSTDGVTYAAANGDVTVAGTGSYTNADGSTGSLADAAFLTGAKSGTEDLKSSTSLASNAALIAAVAAAGLAAEGQATAAHHASLTASLAANGDAPAHNEALAPIALDSVSGGASSLMPTVSNDSAQDSAQSAASHASNAGQSSGLSVAGDAPSGHAPTELLQGTQAPAGGGADNASATAASIVMPSASQLAGVNGVDGAQHNQVVGQVLADALHGGTGGNAIDALINSLPSHEGVNSATDALASHAGSAVPNVDIAALAGFISAHTGLMEQMVVHQVVAAPHA